MYIAESGHWFKTLPKRIVTDTTTSISLDKGIVSYDIGNVLEADSESIGCFYKLLS